MHRRLLNNRTTFTAALVALLICVAAPTAAHARCQVSGGKSGPNPSEWSLTVTTSQGVSCAQAKRVMRRCAASRTVSGWRLSTGSTIKFTRRGNSQRWFRALLAGGTPKCVAKAYED